MWYQNYFVGGAIILLGFLILVFILLFLRGVFKNKRFREILDKIVEFLFLVG